LGVVIHSCRSDQGWWSYFPVVASYKVPIGVGMTSPRPTDGLLLISPVRLAGAYELSDPHPALRSHCADVVIGNSILVFDPDRLGRGSPFRSPPTTYDFALPLQRLQVELDEIQDDGRPHHESFRG
jgi:hypothetical protein